MATYEVNVYVQYDDYEVVVADTPEEAMRLAEEAVCSRITYFGSADVNAYDPPTEL